MNNDATWAVVLILMTLWFADFGAEPQTASVYFAKCTQVDKDGKCLRTRHGPVTSYRAMPANQTVISVTDGVVSPLNDCRVFDRHNWSCWNGSYHSIMAEGDFSTAGVTGSDMRPTSRWQWHLLRVRDWIGTAVNFFRGVDIVGWGIGLVTLAGVIALPSFAWAKAIALYPKLPAYVHGLKPFDTVAALPLRVVICAVVVATGLAIAAAIVSAGVALDASRSPR